VLVLRGSEHEAIGVPAETRESGCWIDPGIFFTPAPCILSKSIRLTRRLRKTANKESAMRELILKMSVSMDGFVGNLDGGAKWVFDNDPKAIAWTVDTVWDASLHIMGSRTFRDMAAYWPTSTEVFAPPMNQIPKAVFTRKGAAALRDARANAGTALGKVKQKGAESWAEAYVAGADLATEVARLKSEDGKPIIAHGGASFARSLVAHGLVDQYALLVHPIALGKGLPIFSELAAPRSFKLIRSIPFPGGSVAQIYRPA
jgi:dihydrofolate reductase